MPRPSRWTVGIFGLALVPRLAYLFLFSDPQNAGDGLYTDVYQHWQIGYLTQAVGFQHGLRLWDLKGVEYFWSTLHPLLLAALFAIFHTSDILVARIVSLVAGSVSVVLIFHLCRRYWGLGVGLLAAAATALMPITVFNDASGMLEPLAIALILLGIWLLPTRPFLAGVSWALASAVRPEAWIFSAGLVIALFFRRREDGDPRPAVYGWALVMALQMAFLWMRTGNPIYPLYWNFLANAGGRWVATPSASQEAMRPVFQVLWGLATAGMAATLWRRPASYLLLLYGFGYSALILGLFAFTSFLSAWWTWSWMMWILAFPYEFLAILIAVAVFQITPFLPRRRVVAAGIGVLAIALMLLTWGPVRAVYASTTPSWQKTVDAGEYLGALVNDVRYVGTNLNLPPDRPPLTYALVHFGAVDGRRFVSQLYDPIYYLPAGFSWTERRQQVEERFRCWLQETNSRLLAVDARNPVYVQLVADHADWFRQVGAISAYGWTIEEVVPNQSMNRCQ